MRKHLLFILNIISNAVTLRRDKSILFSRVALLILILILSLCAVILGAISIISSKVMLISLILLLGIFLALLLLSYFKKLNKSKLLNIRNIFKLGVTVYFINFSFRTPVHFFCDQLLNDTFYSIWCGIVACITLLVLSNLKLEDSPKLWDFLKRFFLTVFIIQALSFIFGFGIFSLALSFIYITMPDIWETIVFYKGLKNYCVQNIATPSRNYGNPITGSSPTASASPTPTPCPSPSTSPSPGPNNTIGPGVLEARERGSNILKRMWNLYSQNKGKKFQLYINKVHFSDEEKRFVISLLQRNKDTAAYKIYAKGGDTKTPSLRNIRLTKPFIYDFVEMVRKETGSIDLKGTGIRDVSSPTLIFKGFKQPTGNMSELHRTRHLFRYMNGCYDYYHKDLKKYRVYVTTAELTPDNKDCISRLITENKDSKVYRELLRRKGSVNRIAISRDLLVLLANKIYNLEKK